ncbi:SGNH/GDSL hydrolase family protein, partial [Candidatus Daviesbacteria bacterium]|nr:SGNH/GDSL hydrolase family protein [Candidatus Daviesbacteria bacterium]
MKKILPKFLAAFISLAIIAYFVSLYIPAFLEKQSLKPPKPYKKLENVQGVSISSESGKVKYPQDYTIVLLGDSMTETLGNADELRGYLNEYFPDKTFEVLNYGYGSTNIFSAKERLTQTTHHANRDFRPILDIDFDYLILESFGHNPLSQYPLEEGLKKQTEVLDDIYSLIATTSGTEKLIFLSTIGTDKKNYAKNPKPDLSPEIRRQWAQERDRYLQNHLSQAKFYGIPGIDVFDFSLDSSGNVKGFLVRNDDN